MKKIVILGSTPETIQIIENIRQNDQESSIALIPFDGYYPYDANHFISLITKEKSFEQIFCQSKGFYKKQSVEVIVDKKITRINFKRNKVFMEERTQISYDQLFIADASAYKFPDIKKINKNRIYSFIQLKDMEEIIKNLSLVDTVMIKSDQLENLSLIKAFIEKEKYVIVLTSNRDAFCSGLEVQEKEIWLKEALEQEHLCFVESEDMVEILGEKDIKAVRLKSGKVMACEMLIFMDLQPDFKMLSDAGLEVQDRICVNEEGITNFGNVVAADGVSQKSKDFQLSAENL